jgi:hypothetical protein
VHGWILERFSLTFFSSSRFALWEIDGIVSDTVAAAECKQSNHSKSASISRETDAISVDASSEIIAEST